MKRPSKTKRSHQWHSAAARRLVAVAGGGVSVEQAVEIVCNRLLKGVRTRPTDVNAVATRVGIIRIETDPALIYAGELRPTAEGLVVACQIGLSRGRKRFTIAHEVGHAVIEGSGPGAPRRGEELERICDLMATELLMPREVFRRAAEGLAGSPADKIITLADQFQVSTRAASIRYSETLPVSVLEFHEGKLVWARGVLRRMPHDIPEALALAQSGQAIDDHVTLPRNPEWGGSWTLNSRPLPSGTGGRVLVTLVPARRN